MLNICLKSKRILNFTERINAFRVIELLQRMDISGSQNIESVNFLCVICRILLNIASKKTAREDAWSRLDTTFAYITSNAK